jgi:outer membrane protein assembly factor BamA
MRGVWTELLIVTAPRFLGNAESPFTRLVAIHRQYHTLVPKVLNLGVRVAYHGNIDGQTPFYMTPYLFTSFSQVTINEGLGGAKSVRGMLRNRTVGQSVAYANLELRYKFLRTRIAKQDLYLAVNGFADAGMVLVPYRINRSMLPMGEIESNYFDAGKDSPHITYGMGLHIALNENFVVSVNYGRATDPRDGKSGLYIGMNWLF